MKNNQDVSGTVNHAGHGKHTLHSFSKIQSDDLSLSKMKAKGSGEDFFPFSRNGTLIDEPTVSGTIQSSDNIKLSLADRISGKELPLLNKSDHMRNSAERSSDISLDNGRSHSNDVKWNSNKDTSEFGLKSMKFLANANEKFDAENVKLHSEFNGTKFSGSSMKKKINADNFRKINLSPVVSKPLEFDRKCAWDIQWASVSKINLILICIFYFIFF